MSETEFTTAMAYLGLAFGKEYTAQEVQQHYEFLKKYSKETIVTAIKELIQTQTFLPKISDLIKTCNSKQEGLKFEILKTMWENGYFAKSPMGETLPLEQQERNYDKAQIWLENNKIPEWFRNDMKPYYQSLLSSTENFLLGVIQ